MKEFNKASLSAKEQLNLLIDRGLIVKDYESALCVLKQNGYYHLSSYMRLFQEGSGHNFIENTEFADIYNLAVFDRKLRFIVFNTLQQIEISYRAAISSVLCKKGSSH